MKFRAHETFFIRKGWLGKGLKNIVHDSSVFVTKEENPMDILGIGANMVKSLRYWMQAVGLSTEPKSGKRIQSLTEWGKLIQQNDPYIEEVGTLLLLQYKLAANYELATSWYFFFQRFNMQEFNKDDFIYAIKNYISMQSDDASYSERSLSDDFNCIINTYLPRYKFAPEKISPENNIDCPLGEIGLIDIVNKEKKIYRKTIPSNKLFSPWITMALIIEQFTASQPEIAQGSKEIKIKSLLHEQNGLAKIFNLDSLTLLEVLRQAEEANLLKIVCTAGLDTIQIINNYSSADCIERYYAALKYTNEGEAI